MEDNYLSNPAIQVYLEQIETGSKEKEVQALVENILWTVFPAHDGWSNLTKYKQGATEPDSKTMRVVHFNDGWATIDVLVGEVKRIMEDISMRAFNKVARDLLDDHMTETTNDNGTTLFGFVGKGFHVVFYKKVIPSGKLEALHQEPLHWGSD